MGEDRNAFFFALFVISLRKCETRDKPVIFTKLHVKCLQGDAQIFKDNLISILNLSFTLHCILSTIAQSICAVIKSRAIDTSTFIALVDKKILFELM